MNQKKLTKDQLKKRTKAWHALCGLGPYTKTAASEPTNEQFQEIKNTFRNASHNRARKNSKTAQLEDYIGSKLMELDEKDASDLCSLWKAAIDNIYRERPEAANRRKKVNKFDDLMYEYVTKYTLIHLEWATSLIIERKKKMAYYFPFMKKACLEAIERNDVNFFARIGDVLRKRQQSTEEYLNSLGYSPLQNFLLGHWIKEIDEIPPLYNLSMNRLWNVCLDNLGNENWSMAYVEKTRQRLGLLSFRKGSPK
jgi:hypothetical protein